MTNREIKFRFVEDFETPYAKIWDFNEAGIRFCMAANKDDQFGHTVEEYVFGILSE